MPQRNALVNLSRFNNLDRVLRRYSWKLLSVINQKRIQGFNQVNLYYNFGRYIYILKRRHGTLYVVKYLKACSLALQRAVAGNPMSSLRDIEPDLPLPRLSSSGLPVMIGTRDRKAIMAGSRKVISKYLTLFGLYRIIDAPVKAKIGTITDPFTGDHSFLNEMDHWLWRNSSQLLHPFRKGWDLKVRRIKLIVKSSPSNTLSWKGLTVDLIPLLSGPLRTAVYAYLKETGSLSFWGQMTSLYKDLERKLKGSFVNTGSLSLKKTLQNLPDYRLTPIGQLSFKKEAAGKLRVFAMVDPWTQSILAPLHDSLFRILGNLPNDGTMDQEAAFARAQQKAAQSGCCYGYDLSAATDRLPIDIQVSILVSLTKSEVLGKAWRHILVSRPYAVPKNNFDLPSTPVGGGLYYSVGQPMGALSSWAMLAITHHMIMQYCSRMEYPIGSQLQGWETRYEVLGDDIVIFDTRLASRYLKVLASLGVPVNESKSVVTLEKSPHKVVEFAKRTSVDGVDCSPLSWKMFLSQDSYPGKLAIIDYLARRKKIFGRFYNMVLSKAPWDNRPLKDHTGIVAFFISVLFNRGGWRAVIPWFHDGQTLTWKSRRLVSNGLPINSISSYISSYFKGSDLTTKTVRLDAGLETQYLDFLRKKRAGLISRKTLSDESFKQTLHQARNVLGLQHSSSLSVLLWGAFAPAVQHLWRIRMEKVRDWDFDRFMSSVKEAELLKAQFELPLQKKESKVLDSLPLSLLEFTRVVKKKDPKNKSRIADTIKIRSYPKVG